MWTLSQTGLQRARTIQRADPKSNMVRLRQRHGTTGFLSNLLMTMKIKPMAMRVAPLRRAA